MPESRISVHLHGTRTLAIKKCKGVVGIALHIELPSLEKNLCRSRRRVARDSPPSLKQPRPHFNHAFRIEVEPVFLVNVRATRQKQLRFICRIVSADIGTTVAGCNLVSAAGGDFKAGIARTVVVQPQVLPRFRHPYIPAITHSHVSAIERLGPVNPIFTGNSSVTRIHPELIELSASGEIDETRRIYLEPCRERITLWSVGKRNHAGDGASYRGIKRLVVNRIRVPGRRRDSRAAQKHHGCAALESKRSIFTKPIAVDKKRLTVVHRHRARHIRIGHDKTRGFCQSLRTAHLRFGIKSSGVNQQKRAVTRRGDRLARWNRTCMLQHKRAARDDEITLKPGKCRIG